MAQLRNYLSFKDFVEKYGLKNEATSNVKIKEILNELNIPCGIYMRDDKFNTTSGIVNLHPTKGTELFKTCLMLDVISFMKYIRSSLLSLNRVPSS